MIAVARAKYLRGSPRRVREVIDLIRGKDVLTSQAILTHVNKGCTKAVEKVLSSAVSNAKQRGLSAEQLFISRITADKAASWRRFRSAAFGRAVPIDKKTTHITVELDLITK